MKKMKSFVLLAAALIIFAGTPAFAREDNRPNLVLILADDLGYSDVGFNGARDIPTPHIDRIAEEGVRFSSGYVTYPVCGPSRAGLITGRYQQRFGFERNPQYRTNDDGMGLTREEETLATVLGRVGYTSGIIGKWHLGAHPDLHPLERGFDYFYGHLGGGHRYFPEDLTIKSSFDAKNEPQSYRTWIMKQQDHVKPTQYLTDAFSDEAVGFIARNKDQPFFLFLSYNAPHGPLQATDKYLDRFPDIKDEDRRTYAAMVSSMDDGVGRVLEALEANGLCGNTLVFFLSDNGGPEAKNASRNDPLRDGKGSVYEGGWRVPFALRWTGKLEGRTVFYDPVSSLDIFATMAALTEAPLNPERPLDGVNLIPHLTDPELGPPHEVLYLRKWDQGAYAVRRGDYKLVIPRGKDSQYPGLYNLARDIREQNNVIVTQRDIFAEIDELRLKWDAQLKEPTFKGLIHTNSWGNRGGSKGKKDRD